MNTTTRRWAAFLAAGLFALGAYAQDEDKFAKVQIETIKVADGVYMLKGQGGNIGLSTGEDGAFLVDDQFAPLSDKIKAAIAAVSDKPVRFLVNTHWHGDHTGGNENFEADGVIIVAQDNVYKRLSTESFSKMFNMTRPARPKEALPVITFTDAVTFHVNGQDIRVQHLEHAHTDGDSVLFFTHSNVLHTGDIFFNGQYPFIDLESGGSVNGVIEAVRTLLPMIDANTKIIPGHGELSDKAGLTAYLEMLTTVRDRVQALIAKGATRDAVIAAKPSAEYDAALGNGFIKPDVFAGVFYDSLTASH